MTNGSSIGKKLEAGLYTRAQAAQLVGKSVDTIKRWDKTGVYHPSRYRRFGKTRVGVYTEVDVQAMRTIAGEIHPGRKARVGDLDAEGRQEATEAS